MNAKEILKNISMHAYQSTNADDDVRMKKRFCIDCLSFLEESGATKGQAERALAKIWVKMYENVPEKERNLNQIFIEVEEIAFIFKDF